MERQKSVLHMTLKRIWFDQIALGKKKKEYREQKAYWERRLAGKPRLGGAKAGT